MFTSHLSGNMKNRAPRANRHITFSRWKTFWVVQPYSGKRSWILISWTCARLETEVNASGGGWRRERERERKKNSPGRSGPGPGRAPRGCKRGARSPRRRPRARNKCRAPYWKNPRLSAPSTVSGAEAFENRKKKRTPRALPSPEVKAGAGVGRSGAEDHPWGSTGHAALERQTPRSVATLHHGGFSVTAPPARGVTRLDFASKGSGERFRIEGSRFHRSIDRSISPVNPKTRNLFGMPASVVFFSNFLFCFPPRTQGQPSPSQTR